MEKLIGTVTHYYSKLGVAIVKLKAPVAVGDTLHFKGATTDFNDTVDSIQIEHKAVDKAKSGQEVGIKVKDKVRDGDEVYLVTQ